MKAVLLLCLVVLVGAIGGIAAAQSSTLIALDTPITGAVTAADGAPSFFFDAAAEQPLTVVIAPADGLVPLVLIAQAADNVVIGTVTGAAGLPRAFATITPRTSGQHFVQVQGVDDTAGSFTLTISTSTAILTPTVTPTLTPPPPTPPTAEVVPAAINDAPRIYTTSSELPAVIHRLEGGDQPQVVTVWADDEQPIRVVLSDTANRVIAALDAPLFGGSLFVPAGADGFTVRVEGVIAAPVAYSIRAQTLSDFTVGLPVTPDAPTPTPIVIATNTPSAVTPTFAPTPTLAASDPDLVINWNTTSLVITNISGEFLDIHTLVLQGGNRRVDANIWDQTGTVDIFALPPGSCVGLRTLAFPDAPALPPDCDDLAAWWSSDALAVWLGESFTVQAGTTPLQTCTGAIGQCLVDLPDA